MSGFKFFEKPEIDGKQSKAELVGINFSLVTRIDYFRTGVSVSISGEPTQYFTGNTAREIREAMTQEMLENV